MSAEQDLIRLYEAAMKELYREIAYREGVGNSAAYQRRLLSKVKSILKDLKRKTPNAVRKALESAWLDGVEDFARDVRPAGVTLEPRINWGMLNLLIQNTTDQLAEAANRVGRIWDDAIRRAGVEAARRKAASGQTVDQMRRQLWQELAGMAAANAPPEMGTGRDGQPGIKTRRGVMRLDTYAALVARSTTAEAQNASKIEYAKKYGYDLVRFTSHTPKCARCSQFEGRLFALTKEAANGKYKNPDGKSLHFPYLFDTAFADGYNNIHPNCRHRLIVVVASMMSAAELADWSRKSMRPFTDDRSERERKTYQRIQAENRARWQDRRQWERYRAVLPDQTPANFGAFRTMKRADSERYRFLELDYRRRKKRMDHPELALPNAGKAWAADAKFVGYLFNAESTDGWPKGIAITRRLGYTKDNWQDLQKAILSAADQYPATAKGNSGFGDKYEQMIVLYGVNGRPANMKVGWIVEDNRVKMTTCYLEEVRGWNG